MFLRTCALLLLLWAPCILHAQSYNPDRLFPPDSLKEDLAFLQKKLETVHPNLYLYTPKAAMDSAFRRVALECYMSRTERDFLQRLKMLYRSICDGHTQFMLSERGNSVWQSRRQNERFLPLYVMFDKGKIYITENCGADERYKPGTEISFVTMRTDAVSIVLENEQPRDGYNTTFPKWVAETYFPMLLGPDPDPQRFPVQLNGSKEMLYPRCISRDSLRWWQQQRYPGRGVQAGHGLYATVGKAGGTAVLTIKTLDAEMLQQTYQQDFNRALDEAFADIRKARARQLVLDLRDNQGGDFETAEYLLTYLLQKPLQFLPGNKEGALLRPRKDSFTGPLYLLINGGTFSSAAIVSSYLQDVRQPVIIGEESGGNASHIRGNPEEFILPHTKLRCFISTTDFWYNKSKSYAGGVRPDVPAPRTVADVTAGRDAALEKALMLAAQHR